MGDAYINPYTPTLLYLWNANMDIQFIGSVFDAAKYVCSYVCKREADKLRQVLTEVQRRIPSDATNCSQLWAIGSTSLTHRQLSAQEAAYKMCGLRLQSSSVSVQYLNSRPKALRTRLLVAASKLNSEEELSTDIFVKNIFDRYRNRSKITLFEAMSLFDFTANHTVCPESAKGVYCFALLNSKLFIRKHSHPIILRTSTTTPERNGDDYFLSQLILKYPWRNEDDLTSGFATAEDSFSCQISQSSDSKPHTK